MVEKTLGERVIEASAGGVALEPVEVEALPKLRYASHSSLVVHRECPQRWYYRHVRGLRKADPEDVKVEMDFGSWWHMLRAADSIARGREKSSLKHLPEKLTSTDDGPTLAVSLATPAAVMELARVWFDRQSQVVADAWTERIGEGLPERLWALYTRWKDQWAREISQELPLAVELGWERRLPALPQPNGGLGGMVDPRAVLVGYVDEIYFDTKRHLIVARDHKVSKRLGTQNVADDMMDSQLQLYAWGAAPTVSEWGLGPIRATAYDRARMVKPPTPQVTASGGLSKSVTDYDLQTYLDWARGPAGVGVPWGEEGKFFASGPRKGQPKFGFYVAEEKEIARLSSAAVVSAWFQRTGPTPLNANLIKAHLRAAVDSALDMQATYERAQLENAAARNLTGGNCRWCDFAGLCRSEMFGGAGGVFDLADFRLVEKRRSGR